MDWIKLDTEEKLREAKEASNYHPVILFKHSTTCSISNTVLNRLERNWKSEDVSRTKAYYLDLLAHRNLSNNIAAEFGVEHQSPQVLILQHEKAIYDRSHFEIEYSTIQSELKKLT